MSARISSDHNKSKLYILDNFLNIINSSRGAKEKKIFLLF